MVCVCMCVCTCVCMCVCVCCVCEGEREWGEGEWGEGERERMTTTTEFIASKPFNQDGKTDGTQLQNANKRLNRLTWKPRQDLLESILSGDPKVTILYGENVTAPLIKRRAVTAVERRSSAQIKVDQVSQDV